jgi:surface antigen
LILYDTIKLSVSSAKTKTMLDKIQIPSRYYKMRATVSVLVLAGLISGAAVVHADQYDVQINNLSQQNSQAQSVVTGLEAQANSYQAAINQLQVQISAIQAALDANLARQAVLQQQIIDAQNKITQQKAFLAENITAMYTDGQLSTIEELATSSSLSDYVDKEEYRIIAQNKINSTIKEIAVLQAQLQKQKLELDDLITAQKAQNDQLRTAEAEQQHLLAYNEGQQAAYNQQISANSSQIAELRRQQIIANSRFSGGAAGSGPTCGGGYPAQWCERGQDTVLDDWGMYNRECVSYTAFRVAASGRHMPGWGWQSRGNANQWDDAAIADGIPVDSNPRAGDVAISNRGTFGHAMYVESVNGDGTINISQYNVNLDGRYSTRAGVDPAGLVFIHF